MYEDNQREDTFYAYMAGIIDGEGTIGFARYKANPVTGSIKYIPYIQVVNTNCLVIEMASKLFCNSTIRKHIGSKNGFQSRLNCYATRIAGPLKVPTIIKKIYPYLVIKKELADIIMDYCLNKKNFEGRPHKGQQSKIPIEESQWRANIYAKYISIIHPQRLNRTTHESVK